MLIRANIILLVVKLSLESSEYSASSTESENSESNEVINDFGHRKSFLKTPATAIEDIYGDIEGGNRRIKIRPLSTKTTVSDEEDTLTTTLVPLTTFVLEEIEEEDTSPTTLRAISDKATKYARRSHHMISSTVKHETTTMINRGAQNEPPKLEDCKELYAAQSVVEKGYAQMSRPFAVSIHKKGAFYATGALLDHSWILTSAGEFYNVRESTRLFKARLGSFDCKRGGTLVPIKSVYIHPLYVQGLPSFDVALLKIASPVSYTCTIMPSPLTHTRAGVVKARFMVTYWPKLIVKGQPLPLNAMERYKHQHMRLTLQNLMPWDECFKRLKAVGVTLSKSSLCLRPIQSHHSPCMPDSGAPVLASDKLWGVTSGWVSQNCSKSESPTVITRASSTDVRVWIDAHVALRWESE